MHNQVNPILEIVSNMSIDSDLALTEPQVMKRCKHYQSIGCDSCRGYDLFCLDYEPNKQEETKSIYCNRECYLDYEQ